jgi:hypothetical protein
MDYLAISWSTMKTLKGPLEFDLFYVDRTSDTRGYEVFGYTGRDFLITAAEGDHTEDGTAAKEFLDTYKTGATEVPSRDDAFALSTSDVPATQISITSIESGLVFPVSGGGAGGSGDWPYPAPQNPDQWKHFRDVQPSKSSWKDLVNYECPENKRFCLLCMQVSTLSNINKSIRVQIIKNIPGYGDYVMCEAWFDSSGSSDTYVWEKEFPFPVPFLNAGQSLIIKMCSQNGNGNDDIEGAALGFEVDV